MAHHLVYGIFHHVPDFLEFDFFDRKAFAEMNVFGALGIDGVEKALLGFEMRKENGFGNTKLGSQLFRGKIADAVFERFLQNSVNYFFIDVLYCSSTHDFEPFRKDFSLFKPKNKAILSNE
jgi:hypothetical protein